MIRSQDRSGWFGASDTHTIMGRWGTETFCRWWLVKQGVMQNHIRTRYTMAGTYYEHRILESIGITKTDRQIKKHSLRLRVNLDGEDRDTVYEVKTHKNGFRLSRAYWQQCQVEMFAAQKGCVLIAYHLLEEDYKNFFNPIDHERISWHPIPYDQKWIEGEYLPRLRILAGCLKRGETPIAANL